MRERRLEKRYQLGDAAKQLRGEGAATALLDNDLRKDADPSALFADVVRGRLSAGSEAFVNLTQQDAGE